MRFSICSCEALLFPDLGILKIASQLKNGRGFIVLGGICSTKADVAHMCLTS